MFYRKSPLTWVSLLLVCVLSLACAPLAFGQLTTGTISGTVMDQSGATVPAVTVTVRSLDTNATRTFTTAADGRYNFPGLPVGRYELTAELAGFSKYVRGPINLLVGQEAIVNPELRPAAVEATVMVTEDAPMLNTVNAEVGVRFDERRIAELPVLPPGGRADAGGFRDVFAYALSAPGVSQLNSGNSAFAAGTNFSVNGMRPRGNNFMVDGQDSNDPSVTGRQQVMNNPDVVKEFRLVTNQFAAEYGRAAGSVANVITKSGTNSFHGSAFWFHNSNPLNSRSNLDKAARFVDAPFRIENQFGGTMGGPIWKDHTFFFGSIQRWTDRALGSGTTIIGVPTEAGRQILQQAVGTRPQVQALLRFMPAAQTATGATVPLRVGTQSVQVPVGSLTNATSQLFNDWQWSARIDHNWTKHKLGGRYLYNDSVADGSGQATPPGLTNKNEQRQQAMTIWLTSNISPRMLNEGRISYQRLANVTAASNPAAESIPSIEIFELGMRGFNAATSRTAIGLAVNFPQARKNNTIQIQDTMSWQRGAHELKWGFDVRRIDVRSFFFPTVRGFLQYSTLQNYVDDIAQSGRINIALPGTSPIQYYNWWDYFFFVQDEWRVRPSFTLTFGLRYETPGNAIESQYDENDRIVQNFGGNPVFRLSPRPGRDKNNWQPRFGFSWNPRTRTEGPLGWITGGNKLVLRGGYSRTNDYQFINLALNVATSFPFVAVVGASNLPNAFASLPTLQPNLTNPTALQATTSRTVMGEDFRAPLAEQLSLELQRELTANTVLRVGYVGTKGTGLFETIDGNPRTLCSPIPTSATGTVLGCPRVNPAFDAIRLRANAASSIYHSLQVSLDRRFARGFGAGAHYTWSNFIDEVSDTFNPSARGEIAVTQQSFNRRLDRGRSTYDRPQRFAANFVWEVPFMKNQPGVLGHIVGGWQFASFITFQAGSPFSPLNGADPTLAAGGIDGFVGNPLRPNVAPGVSIAGMTVEQLRSIFIRNVFPFPILASCQRITGTNTCTPVQRFGNAGRNILRSDGIANWDLSILKRTRITETHALEFRADFFNTTNTRNFGIPTADVNNAGFANQWGTDGGNRRIFMSLRYVF